MYSVNLLLHPCKAILGGRMDGSLQARSAKWSVRRQPILGKLSALGTL